MKTYLALDPGVNNFGLAVITGEYSVSKSTITYSFLASEMLQHTLVEIKDSPKQQLSLFLRQIRKVCKEHTVDAIIAERYQNRGIRGKTIEAVNMMLGSLLVCNTLPVTLITAATWKNACNRQLPLKDWYQAVKKPLTPHRLDAALIGLYGLQQEWQLTPFFNLSQKKFFQALNSF